jgi:hypothetical protein
LAPQKSKKATYSYGINTPYIPGERKHHVDAYKKIKSEKQGHDGPFYGDIAVIDDVHGG